MDFYHLRTADGRAVDLLIEREDGFIAVEVKQTHRVGRSDFRHLRRLEDLVDKPLLLGLVVSNDTTTGRPDDTEPNLWNVAAPWLLSC